MVAVAQVALGGEGVLALGSLSCEVALPLPCFGLGPGGVGVCGDPGGEVRPGVGGVRVGAEQAAGGGEPPVPQPVVRTQHQLDGPVREDGGAGGRVEGAAQEGAVGVGARSDDLRGGILGVEPVGQGPGQVGQRGVVQSRRSAADSSASIDLRSYTCGSVRAAVMP